MSLKYLFLAVAAVFFTLFGIGMLITSYYQNEPVVFLALFFSSSLIILVSLTCLIGSIIRLRPKPDDRMTEKIT